MAKNSGNKNTPNKGGKGTTSVKAGQVPRMKNPTPPPPPKNTK